MIFSLTVQSVEISWDSPPWCDYLLYLDNMIWNGLKQMILSSMNTLTTRAQKYEQVYHYNLTMHYVIYCDRVAPYLQ